MGWLISPSLSDCQDPAPGAGPRPTPRRACLRTRRVWHPPRMRTIIAVSIVALLALMAGSASGAGQARPILLLIGDTSLHGMHFRAMERVHVVVVNRHGTSKWVRTSRTGAF